VQERCLTPILQTGGVPAIEPPVLRDGDLTLRPPRPPMTIVYLWEA
jgi:hypothetical protein